MLPGVYLLGNFWSSAFQTMLLQAGWQVVAILYIEIVFVSMGIFFISNSYMFTLYGQNIVSSCISYQRVQ